VGSLINTLNIKFIVECVSEIIFDKPSIFDYDKNMHGLLGASCINLNSNNAV